ncbi:DUF4192 family protein [Planomonospora corallina]|uniref:DUF4192 family protein n=1 Tax=Planomonospora corallina TaxID=1806052 RepID=A0ABV8I8I9_9ACTN
MTAPAGAGARPPRSSRKRHTIMHSDLLAYCRALRARIHANGNRPDLAFQLTAENTTRLDRLAAGLLPDDEMVMLGIAANIPQVRDLAMAAITPKAARDQARLWTSVGEFLHPAFVTPAAFLAGYACAVSGDLWDGLVAAELALACDAHFELAHLLDRFLREGRPVPPAEFLTAGMSGRRPAADWLAPLASRLDPALRADARLN